jgi:hypothetical protein
MEGDLVFVDEGTPCPVSYQVDCDDSWLTSRAVVRSKRLGVLRAGANRWESAARAASGSDRFVRVAQHLASRRTHDPASDTARQAASPGPVAGRSSRRVHDAAA